MGAGGTSLDPKGDPLSTIHALSLQPQQSQTFVELIYYYTLSRESTAKMKKPDELFTPCLTAVVAVRLGVKYRAPHCTAVPVQLRMLYLLLSFNLFLKL